MKVKDICQMNVPFIRPDMTYLETAKFLKKHKMIGAPVIDDNSQIIGIISEKDLLKVLYPFYSSFYESPEHYTDSEKREEKVLEIKDKPITKFMNKRVTSFDLDEPIMQAGGTMLARGLHLAPVVDKKGKLVGMLYRHDIYQNIFDKYLFVTKNKK